MSTCHPQPPEENSTDTRSAILSRLAGISPTLKFALFAGLLLVIPGIAQPGFTKIFIDDILSPMRREWLRPLLFAMAASIAAIWILSGIQRRTLLRQTLKSSISESADFISHAIRLPYSFFTRFHGGEIGMRSQYIVTVSKVITEDLTTTAITLITICMYAVVMLQYDIVLTSLALFAALLNVIILKFGISKGQRLLKSFVAEYSKVRAVGLRGLQIIEQIKASGWEKEFFVHWAGNKVHAQNIGQRYSLWMLSLMQVPLLLADLSMAALLGIGSLRVMEGSISMGMLAAFQALLIAFITPMQQFLNSSATFLTLGAYIKSIEEVTEHPIDPLFDNEQENGFVLPGVGVRLTGNFELRDVTFGYLPDKPPLIRNFSLKVAPGSRVALVGRSGSGKSTIVRLIAQLYRPWSGEILFDSISRSKVPHAVFANSVSFVDQEIFLFEGSVSENITMWNPAVSEKEIIQAAKDAEIHEVIASRPGGGNSRVLCGGANFSGGQRQRLEIARALATNPSIVILDEATSALDSETEERIDAALRRRGVTCLIVAHRLSTIRDADEIIVMDQGVIVERGTHEELMASSTHYAQLLMN